MSRREAEQLEEALHRISQGEPIESETVPLLETAQELRHLASPPPPPPHRLLPGRQRFLAEAARLRAARKSEPPVRRSALPRAVRLGVAAAALLLVFGVLFGSGRAVAHSLPGSPLYGLKLAAENARLSLLSDPRARASLLLGQAENRLDEVIALLEMSRPVESTAVKRTLEQWRLAAEAASDLDGPDAEEALQHVYRAIEQRQTTLASLAGPNPEPLLRELLREMERLRQEAHLGEGVPEGQQERHRTGEPIDPTDLPLPSKTPLPHQTAQPTPGSGRTSTPSHTPHWTARPSVTPKPSSTSYRTAMPSETAQASQPSGTPAHEAAPSMTPQTSQTPRRTSEPTATPAGPQATSDAAAPSSPQGGGANGSP